MLSLVSNGFPKNKCKLAISKKFPMSTPTFNRYWCDMFKDFFEDIQPKVEESLKAVQLQSFQRCLEAARMYNETKDKDWLREWREEAKFYNDFLKSLGLLNSEMIRVDVKVSSESSEPIDVLIAAQKKYLIGRLKDDKQTIVSQ